MRSIVLGHEFGIAVALTAASMLLQSTGMALLIVWGRGRFQKLQRLGPVHGTLLMIRITGIMVGLHLLQVCLWAPFTAGDA